MRVLLAALLVVPALSGCGERIVDARDAGPQPTHVIIGSDHPRDLDPQVDPGDLADLVAARNSFAFEIYQGLRDRAGNLVYSPHSISASLARAFAGARRQTETELVGALQFAQPASTVHAGLNALDLAFTRDRPGFEWHSAQSLWGQVGIPYLVDYLDLLAESYGADLHLVDFVDQPYEAREVINSWVADQTGGEVDALVEESEIPAVPHLLLGNGVSLSSSWRDEFPDQLTEDADFHLLDGGSVTVSMMVSQHSNLYRHAGGDGYEAMELMCLAGDLSMLLVLPESGRFVEVENRLDAALLAEIDGGLATTSMSISLPKWSTRSRFNLGEVLGDMGMAEAFSPLADFSGITGNVELRMGAVVHEANIAVDEVGINATSGSLGISDGTPDRVVFDRPFFFLVRDTETGAILFAGRVLDPADG